MPSNSTPKSIAVLTRLIAGVLAILIFPLGNVALAQPVFEDGLDVAVTSFYTSASRQERKVEVFKNILDYDVAVPLNVKDLSASQVGNGVFQAADLDFSTAQADIPGTATRIQFSGPVISVNGKNKTGLLYSVVAGKTKENSCPVEIEDTQIAFFESRDEAAAKAQSLAEKDYLVYVSVDSGTQDKAIAKIKELNCQPNAEGIVVNGKTQKVTVDFTQVFNLLPPRFQQPAREEPFVYFPKGGAIYLVNARKIYGLTDLEVGLYDADTDELVATIENGTTLHISNVGDRNLTIAAVVPSDSAFTNNVGSVLFNLNGGKVTKTENIEPYAIFGDNPRGDLNGGSLDLEANNTLAVEVFDQRQGQGSLLGNVTLSFSIADN